MFYFTPLVQHLGDVARLGYPLSLTGNQLVEKSSFFRAQLFSFVFDPGVKLCFCQCETLCAKIRKRNI